MTASSFIDSHASRLGVNASRRGEAITLRLSGEADMASSEEIARCLSSLRLTGGVAVRLEVTALRFADAATVSALGAFARTKATATPSAPAVPQRCSAGLLNFWA